MNFPGDNEIRLSRDTVRKIVSDHVKMLTGEDVRITRIMQTSSYGESGLTIDFTTDPEPPPRAPAPPPPVPEPPMPEPDPRGPSEQF